MLVKRHHVFFALFALLALLCPPGPVSAQTTSEKLLPVQVLQDLLDRHGDNNTISVPQLRALLVLLSQPQGEEAKGDDNLHAQAAPTTTSPNLNGSKCLAANVLGIYSIGEQSRLDSARLHQLCPVLLQELDTGTCRTHQEEDGGDASPRPSDAEGQRGAREVAQTI